METTTVEVGDPYPKDVSFVRDGLVVDRYSSGVGLVLRSPAFTDDEIETLDTGPLAVTLYTQRGLPFVGAMVEGYGLTAAAAAPGHVTNLEDEIAAIEATGDEWGLIACEGPEEVVRSIRQLAVPKAFLEAFTDACVTALRRYDSGADRQAASQNIFNATKTQDFVLEAPLMYVHYPDGTSELRRYE